MYNFVSSLAAMNRNTNQKYNLCMFIVNYIAVMKSFVVLKPYFV